MKKKLCLTSGTQRRIRQIWSQYILPAYTSRDKTMLLAALVMADTSLDELLVAEGYAGETDWDRLQNARRSFSNYACLLAARNIRNLAVHNLDYHLCWPAAASALASYALALWEHGVNLESI